MQPVRAHRVSKRTAVTAIVLLVGSFLVVTLARAPSALACNPVTDPNCVGVGVASPGGPGGGDPAPGGHPVKGVGGPSKPDPCAEYPGPLHTQCKNNVGVQCLDLYNTYSGTLSFDDLNAILSANACPTLTQAQAPPPSPATLAQRAAATFRLPDPSGARSPSQSLNFHGYSDTYVGLWTWFWTDATKWADCGATCTATARAGGNYATVTARPVSLTFDPGDGSGAFSCAGPGVAWQNSFGNDAPSSHGGCGYQYRTVTGPGYDHPVTSTQTIRWQLTWTGSGNTSGTLTSKTTSATGKLNVLQIQTVVTR